jgi:hypothetical protein
MADNHRDLSTGTKAAYDNRCTDATNGAPTFVLWRSKYLCKLEGNKIYISWYRLECDQPALAEALQDTGQHFGKSILRPGRVWVLDGQGLILNTPPGRDTLRDLAAVGERDVVVVLDIIHEGIPVGEFFL